MLKEETKMLLKEIRDNKYTFEGIDKELLVLDLIENIGDVDGEVRDGLIYPCLAHLLHDNHFSEEKLEEFLSILTNENHLFFDIEKNSKNSVLVRSFCSLQIAILVFVHNRDGIIKREVIDNLLQIYLKYFNLETHYEGYNNQVGWLHSIAHAADVFSQFFSIESLDKTKIETIFNAIALKMKQYDYYFSHDEDERMVVGLNKAIRKNILDRDFVLDWIKGVSIYDKTGKYPEMYFIKNNVRNLLRSLYFSFIDDSEYIWLTDEIKRMLKDNVTLR